MRHDLSIALTQVTEAAALEGYKWLGRGDKMAADNAAVEAMRYWLNESNIDGEIVIGEGEIDDAPMLYIGEKLGKGGDAIDIAVDPIEGTRMTAMGQSNAIAVLAATEKGGFLKAPDMYMEKLVVGPNVKGAIDLSLTIEENVQNVARKLNKPISELTVVTLAKSRHDEVIARIQKMGAKVFALPDGDVAASILTCLPESDVDMMYCIGGAPEGVITAAVIKALDGDMQGKLKLRDNVKGPLDANVIIAEEESSRCEEMGVVPETILELDDMVKTKNVIFCATGITKGDLLEGVQQQDNSISTETLLILGESKIIRTIKSTHELARVNSTMGQVA